MVNSSISVDQLVAETTWLHRMAVALVKDEAAADDLIQDTYVIAATEAPDDGRPLRPWLVRVLWNRVKMRTRGSRRRRAREESFGELATPPMQPDEIVDRIELHRLLAGLVLELPVPQRDVLLLRFFEGLSSSQIGNRLGISAGTVRWRLKTAVDTLRERLEEHRPNRAWVAPLVALARTQTAATVATTHVLLIAAAVVVLVIAGLLVHGVTSHSEVHAIATSHHADHRDEAKLAAMAQATPSSSMAPEPARTDGTLGADHRRLHGTVVDRDGALVEGAEVSLDCEYRGANAIPNQRTGPNGEFAFDADHECNFLLHATKGSLRGTVSRMTRFGERPLEIRLRPVSVGVVRVLDGETGAPVANAAVIANEMFGGQSSTVTGPDGIARFDIAMPSWVRVQATDYVQLERVLDPRVGHEQATTMTFDEGQPIDNVAEARLDVRLSRGVVVAGTIVGPDNTGVAFAHVQLIGPTTEAVSPSTDAHADASGHFELTAPRGGRYRISADSETLASAKPPLLDVATNGLDNIVVRVARRPELRGTVVDGSFKPVEGAKVSIADGSTHPAATDAQGHFSIMVDDDRPIDVIARLGADSSAYQHLQLELGKPTEIQLQLGPSGISGTAVDRGGSPVPNAIVWLNGCCASNPHLVGPTSAIADARGKFTFDVPRGDYVLSVKRDADDDYLDEDDVKVTGGSRDIHVIVP